MTLAEAVDPELAHHHPYHNVVAVGQLSVGSLGQGHRVVRGGVNVVEVLISGTSWYSMLSGQGCV